MGYPGATLNKRIKKKNIALYNSVKFEDEFQ
jgi:hypothetical protein